MRILAPIFGALASLGAIACSGSTSDIGPGGSDAGTDANGVDAPAPVTAEQAVTDVLTAYCNKAESCAPLYLQIAFGDVATCIARNEPVLLSALQATGTSSTPAQTEACARAIGPESCADLLSRNLPQVCVTKPGQLANGAACGADGQCMGTRCLVTAGASCGTCGAHATAGGGCASDDDCDVGLTCANMLCVKYGAGGDACDASHPCRPDLRCKAGTCATPLSLGTTCDPKADACDFIHAQYCNPTTKQCDTLTFAQPSAMCGLVGGAYVACAGAGASCTGVMAPTYQGTCAAGLADGASCGATGAQCQMPAACVNGQCTVPVPSACK